MSALKLCPQCGTEYELDQRFCPKDGSTLKIQGGEAMNDLVGQIIADRYHVLKKLGEGGMGQVYLAEHVKMGRKSAVKVMNPGMVNDADAISRFNREASNASRIGHPNVAAIYDFGETADGLIYLAMEYVEGSPLTNIIESLGIVPPRRAADITRQTGEALNVAHDLGIVHRDLKPDNIMIAKGRDGADLVKVVDFGIAKAGNVENQKVTKTGLVVGTPEYMSPEQLSGDKLDGRSDIYSLGLVAFNMLTGKLPFPSETAQESMIMRLTDRPRTLGEMSPEFAWPPEIQQVMDRALARDVNERYHSASEFGRDLARAVESIREAEPVELKTMVMGAASVPATRIASSSGPSSRQPTPGQATIATPSPAATPTSSKTPLVLGIAAAVVILGAGGTYWQMNKGAANSKADTTALAPANPTTPANAGAGGAGGASGSTGPAAGATQQQQQTATPPRTQTQSAVVPPLPGATKQAAPVAETNYLPQIREIYDGVIEKPATASSALTEIENLAGKLSSAQDVFDAKYVKAVTMINIENRKDDGCALLKSLQSDSKRPRFGTPISMFLAACD